MYVDFIGMPLCLGASTTGMEHGPEFVRRAGLGEIFSSHVFADKGDVPCRNVSDMSVPDMKNLAPILAANERLADAVSASLSAGHFPLVFGGDHSLAWGSISGVASVHAGLSVIYIDAHGDFNTRETSQTHNVHGMHMSYLMGLSDDRLVDFYRPGRKLSPRHVHFIGSRAFDSGEHLFARQHGMHVITASEAKIMAPEECSRRVIRNIQDSGTPHVHISLDVDAIDPTLAPGTGVPEPDGLAADFLFDIVGDFLRSLNVVSMDIVEYNPRLDVADRTYHVCLDILRVINKNLR